MKRVLLGFTAALLAGSLQYATAQPSDQGPSVQGQSRYDQSPKGQPPGGGGVSKPGVAGKPGGKSGALETPQGDVRYNAQQQAEKRNQDQSHVQGKPGSESGRPSPSKPGRTD